MLERAIQAKRRNLNYLLSKPNVVACGVGYKETDGVITDEPAVIVSVERKIPAAQLAPQAMVPKTIEDVRTDVVEVGRIKAWQSPPPASSNPRDRWRPAPGGVSIGHVDITAGTLGCLVIRGGELFILSNNHVLADVNRGRIGDPIIQPGRYDGGTLADEIALLADFIPIRFGTEEAECPLANGVERALNWAARAVGSSHRMQSYRLTPAENRVDAAIARPLSPDLVERQILEIGLPQGVHEATLGTRVQKSGRTTGHTWSTIRQIDVTVGVDYDGRTATFTDQFMAGAMSGGGDSGSAVLDEEGYVVGLLFAGSDLTTVINPIQFVLDALGVQIAT